ncbi:MAG: MFS transporter [Microthrixaceae bacterium]
MRPWWVLVTLCWSLLVIGLNTTGINTAIGVIAEDFEMSTTAVAWAVNAYLLAAATTVAAGGQFGDVLGRRRMFAIGLGLFAVGSATIAAAPGPEVLVAGRAFQGMASGLMLPAQAGPGPPGVPEAKQGTAVGIWAATASFTFAVGPLYGEPSPTRSVGVGCSQPICCCWRWAGCSLGSSCCPFVSVSGARPDLVGAASLGAATIAAIVVLQQGWVVGMDRTADAGCGRVGVASGVVFVLAEKRTDDPLVHLSLFRSRAYSAGVITTFAQGFDLMGLLYFVSIFTESAATYDLSALDAGLVLVPGDSPCSWLR